jgi:hypothetical protein
MISFSISAIDGLAKSISDRVDNDTLRRKCPKSFPGNICQWQLKGHRQGLQKKDRYVTVQGE